MGWVVDQVEIERLLESLAKEWNLEFDEQEYNRILNESQEKE